MSTNFTSLSTSKKFISFLWHLIIFYFLFVVSSMHGFLLLPSIKLNMPLRSIIFTALVFFTILGLAYLNQYLFKATYLLKPIKFSRVLLINLCAATVTIMFSMVFIGNHAILAALSSFSWNNFITYCTIQKAQHVFQTNNSDLIILTIVASCIAGPIIEELIFRGVLFEYCASIFKHAATTIVIVSIIFALCHHIDAFGPFLNHIIFSVVLCFLRQKYRSLCPGILIHMINNLISILVLFL